MKQENIEKKALSIKWQGKKRISYLNCNYDLYFIEAQERARNKEYSEISLDWTGLFLWRSIWR